MSQDYHGHLTIFPSPVLRDYIRILENPQEEDFQRCAKASKTLLYAHYSCIKNIMAIEGCLDKHYRWLNSKIIENLNLFDEAEQEESDIPSSALLEHRKKQKRQSEIARRKVLVGIKP
jgi:hypothetical protein